MSLTIAPSTTLPQTDFDGIARALRHLRYVSQHASPKLDQPERYELGEAVKLLKGLVIAKPDPEADPEADPQADAEARAEQLDREIAAGYNRFIQPEITPEDLYHWDQCRCPDCMGMPEEQYEPLPAEFVQPAAPWYLGLDGALFYVPDFAAVDIDAIAF